MDLVESAPEHASSESPPVTTAPAPGCPMHAGSEEAVALCPMDAAALAAGTPERSAWDLRARRVLRLPADAPRESLLGANNAFAKSMWISATGCLITYVALPLLGPIVGLSGVFGPVLGIVLSLVSMTAIFFSVRRFFAGDHPWRWRYTAIGGGVFILLIIQLFQDANKLLG